MLDWLAEVMVVTLREAWHVSVKLHGSTSWVLIHLSSGLKLTPVRCVDRLVVMWWGWVVEPNYLLSARCDVFVSHLTGAVSQSYPFFFCSNFCDWLLYFRFFQEFFCGLDVMLGASSQKMTFLYFGFCFLSTHIKLTCLAKCICE